MSAEENQGRPVTATPAPGEAIGEGAAPMTTATFPIVDGDIFRWRYKDEKPEHLREYGRYHCKSLIAVAQKGWLVDTFWSSPTDGSWLATYADAPGKLELSKLGNFADLEKRDDYHRFYYDDADVVDLSHSNSSRDNLYIRKGAVRSREKMRAVMLERIETAKRELQSAQWRLERERKILVDLDAATDLDKVYL
jgi:hypothetical protein